VSDLPQIRRKAERVSAAHVLAAFRGVGRRSLLAWLDAAGAHDMPVREAVRRLAKGEAALEAGRVALEGQLADPEGPAARAACAEGCAFCCILAGEDGGTMTEAEAVRLHASLSRLAGEPDGRVWHPRACPALDPETRTCRAYDARPSICRSYISPDAALCEDIAEGTPRPGPGVLGGHVLYLSVLALTRETLRGVAAVPTYSLARLAAAAVRDDSLEEALAASRHAPRELRDEIARHKKAMNG
jgi:hypothetical protein